MGWRQTHTSAALPLTTSCSVSVLSPSRGLGLMPGETRPPTSHFPGQTVAWAILMSLMKEERMSTLMGAGESLSHHPPHQMGIRQLINGGGAHQAEMPFVTSYYLIFKTYFTSL